MLQHTSSQVGLFENASATTMQFTNLSCPLHLTDNIPRKPYYTGISTLEMANLTRGKLSTIIYNCRPPLIRHVLRPDSNARAGCKKLRGKPGDVIFSKISTLKMNVAAYESQVEIMF